MFRAQINQLAGSPTLTMEGDLVGVWAEEAKSLVTSGPVPKGLIVDLADVRKIDSVGEQVLVWLASVGSSFMPNGLYVPRFVSDCSCRSMARPLVLESIFEQRRLLGMGTVACRVWTCFRSWLNPCSDNFGPN